MTFSIVLLTTAKRTQWLEESIASIDRNYFDQKILSVDEFDGYIFPDHLKEKYIKEGWKVVVDNHKSKLSSLINAVSLVTSDYVFYQEDDIVANLPDKNYIEDLLDLKVLDRYCGIISLNLGGAITELKDRIYGDLIECEERKILQGEYYYSFIRCESRRNAWFFEFPSFFIRTDHFLQSLIYVRAQNWTANHEIEQNLTKSWFNNGMYLKYYKCCITKNNLKTVLIESPTKMMDLCGMIKILDPHQGGI